MYTIGSFLREEELTGLKLMTDTADLQAEITNINIIDNPDSYDWLSSGDFLLTTGYFLRDDEAMQRQLVRELSELGCVGLAIKTRRYLDVIPEAMLEEANRLGFPLINIPVQYPLSKICKVVFGRLSGGGVEKADRFVSLYHSITESMLEIATGVCRDISHAQIQLSAIQQAVQRAALRHHLQICGGGSHPFHAWQRQQISDNPRYVKPVEHFGYLAQQATVFGQHVHVGCQSGDDAIYLLHGLSRFVPHFIALNAASPWFDSTDSRFACSRLNRFSSYPDNGPMPWVADWQGFRRLFRQLSYTSMIDSMKDLHWDIRPSPQFGTVEVRVMDTPLTLAQAIHIAGFIQTLACWLLTERPFKHQPDDYLLYPFNRYQACRYGLDGTLTDVRSGEQRSIRQEILQLADRLAPFAHQLKATAALEAVVRQAKSPHSEAQQMRDFIANGGSLSGLVQKHCEIWAA